MFQEGKNPVVDEIIEVVRSVSKAEQKRILQLLKSVIADSRQKDSQKTKRKLSETEYLLKSSANKRALFRNLKSRRKKTFRGNEFKALVDEKAAK